jgi:UDP-glucose 4-epimerase
VYAGGVARACVQAMDAAGATGAFNVASGRSTSVNEVVAMVLEEYGSRLEPEHVADTRTVRSTAHHELHISTARAKEILGWEPTVPLREGITRLRRWLDALERSIPS